MIVISQALVLAPSYDEPLSNPVLGWHSRVTVDSLAADTELEEFPAVNLANPDTSLFWRAEDASEQHLTVTLGGAQPVDYLAVARHNFGSSGCVVSVEALIDEEWVEIFPEILPANNAPLLFRFVPTALEAVRLRMQPDAEISPSIPPEASVLFVGKLVVFQRGVSGPFTPLPYGHVRDVRTGRSESGNYLGRVQVGGHSESVATFHNLTADWFRENLAEFLDNGELPFFFAWHPEDYPEEIGFAWLNTDRVVPEFEVANYVSISLPMTGILS